jgi:hypothetical protein
MRKYWLVAALAVTFSIQAPTLQAWAEMYRDVQGNWAQSDINSVVDMNVMSGFNDGMFHPEAWVSRSEFTTMSARALGLPPNQVERIPSLRKVARNEWNFGSVNNSAWLSAYPAGVYRPDSPLRRVEMLVGMAGTLNKPLVSSAEADRILSRYSDANQVPSNVRREVATAIQYNLFATDPQLGGGNLIDPLRPATRAEVASVLNDLAQNRELTIVRDGQIITTVANDGEPISPMVGTTAVTTTTTTTESVGESANVPSSGRTSAVREESESTTESTTTTGATDTYGATSASQTNTQNAANSSFSPYTNAPKKSWVMGSAVPFRNSADTIVETRMVNQTTTPTNLDANIVSTLPTNATFMATVAKALYSEFNKPGDPVMLILEHSILDTNSKVIIPAGSKILGYVTTVVSRNQSGDDAQLGIQLTSFITPAGQRIPINATIANTDGILKAGDLQGAVFKPDRSVAALKREINTAEGAMYGTKIGKAAVLDEPFSVQVSAKPLDPMDKRTSDIVLGVGDQLQLRLGDAATEPRTETENGTTTTPATTPSPSFSQ